MKSQNKKILVLGDGDSVFVKDFINQYHKQDVIVDLISLTNAKPHLRVRNQINCPAPDRGTFGKVGVYLSWLQKIKYSINSLEEFYDAIIIHSVNMFLGLSVQTLKRKTSKLVTVVWGSDYYRANGMQNILKRKIYRGSDNIVFTNPETRDHFSKNNSDIPQHKLKIARFGLPVLDEIDKLRNSTDAEPKFHKLFGLPHDKLIVLVGYSASSAHRQTLVIDAIAKLEKETIDAMHLVFPLGYGSKQIIEKIENALADAQLSNYSILTEFYDFSEIAKLRGITDVLINIQASDQFSGSMQETLYAGGNIIAGAWLPYEEIIRIGCKIILIQNPEYVGQALNNLIESGDAQAQPAAEPVKNYIQNSSSWNKNISIWNDILFAENRAFKNR